VYCDNTTLEVSEKGVFQLYVQWQGMSIVETWRADKATRRADVCCQMSRTNSCCLWRWTSNRARDAM